MAITTAAAAAGIGIAVLPCIGADVDPRLIRLSDVVESFEGWIVTTHEARNNARIRAVKDALVEMIRAAAPELSGSGDPK